jgi:hypothetical protein
METIVDYRKLVFLEQLCNLPKTYMAKHLFNSRLLYYENFDKQHHGFIPDIRAILCKYELHHILDQYIAEGLFPVKSVWKTMLRRHVTQKRNVNLFQECSEKYPFLGSTILRSDGVCGLWTIARNNPELSSLCSKTMRVIGRLTMPAYINTCALCNGVNLNIVHHRILLCNMNSNIREQLWNTIIDTNGLGAFNQMCRSSLSEQCNYILRMFLNINYDNLNHTKLSSLVCKMFLQ